MITPLRSPLFSSPASIRWAGLGLADFLTGDADLAHFIDGMKKAQDETKHLSAQQITDAETFTNSKTGAY